LFAHDRWVSPGTPASSTTKPGRHDIAEILLKVALKHLKSERGMREQQSVEYAHVSVVMSFMIVKALVLICQFNKMEFVQEAWSAINSK
jgi:hypothetical protein